MESMNFINILTQKKIRQNHKQRKKYRYRRFPEKRISLYFSVVNSVWYFVKAYAIMSSTDKINECNCSVPSQLQTGCYNITLERQDISCRYYTKAQEEKKKP